MAVDAVARQFGLGPIRHIGPHASSGGVTVVNDHATYVIRPVTFPSRIGTLLFEDAFTRFLAEAGFPAQRFRRTCDGRLVADVAAHQYFVNEYIEGDVHPLKSGPVSAPRLVGAAMALARLHMLSRSYDGPRSYRLPYAASRTAAMLHRLRDVVAARDELDRFDELALAIIHRSIDVVARSPFDRQRFLWKGPVVVNHGDYHPGNVVYGADGTVVGVLDFEACRAMPRIWDIAWALACFCRVKATGVFVGPMSIERIRCFLEAYGSVSPLSDDEQEGLSSLFVSAGHHSTYTLESYGLRGTSTLEPFGTIEEYFWWESHQALLEDVIRGACGTRRYLSEAL